MKKIIVVFLTLIVCLSLCACGKSEAVKNVEKAIAEIGEITLSSYPVIDNATALLDALTSEEQAQVKNIKVLYQAQEKLQEILDEQISLANATVSRYAKEAAENHYVIESRYVEEEKAYIALMAIDTIALEKYVESLDFYSSDLASSLMGSYMRFQDENTEYIEFMLLALKQELMNMFPEDSGIILTVGYCDRNGDITHCY